MSLAEVVAWVMLAILIAWVGIVLFATLRQLDGEASEMRRGRGRHD